MFDIYAVQDHLDYLEQQDRQESEYLEQPAHLEQQDRPDPWVRLVQLALLVQLGMLAQPDLLERLVQQDRLDWKVLLEAWGLRVPQVRLALPGHLPSTPFQVIRELRVPPEQPDQREAQAHRVQVDHLEHLEAVAIPVRPVHPVARGRPERLEQPGPLEQLEIREYWAALVLPDRLEPLEAQAFRVRWARLVPPGLQDRPPVGREESTFPAQVGRPVCRDREGHWGRQE